MTLETVREPHFWLLVSGIANFRASRDLGFTQQGVKSRHRRKAERMAPGDRLIFYVTGLKAIAGIVTVTSPYFESHERIWSSADPKKDAEDYPFRVFTEPDLILPEAAFIPAEPLAMAMEYTKRWPARNWTLAFQGNVHNLPAGDYELIWTAIRERMDRDANQPTIRDDAAVAGQSCEGASPVDQFPVVSTNGSEHES